jgi:hypothetical protein
MVPFLKAVAVAALRVNVFLVKHNGLSDAADVMPGVCLVYRQRAPAGGAAEVPVYLVARTD